jgi:anti-anti-sigma factor
MKIDTQVHGTVVVLVPHGALVADELAGFRRTVQSAIEQKAGRVIIDCTQIPYVDSAAIEAMQAYGQSQANGQPKLAGLSDTVREALDLTDVLPQLQAFDTVENAIRSFKR